MSIYQSIDVSYMPRPKTQVVKCDQGTLLPKPSASAARQSALRLVHHGAALVARRWHLKDWQGGGAAVTLLLNKLSHEEYHRIALSHLISY